MPKRGVFKPLSQQGDFTTLSEYFSVALNAEKHWKRIEVCYVYSQAFALIEFFRYRNSVAPFRNVRNAHNKDALE